MTSAIGIDIGGTHLRAARVGADGSIQARSRAASSPDPQAVLRSIESLAAEVDDQSVRAIGIGVPGRVDFAARKILSGGYVDLSRVPLAAHLEHSFQRPVVIDNDASMALVAEAAIGAARAERDIVMLTIGTGIGGAIMSGGRLLRGSGTAGQLGHVCIDAAGLPCVCGKLGCVETVSSGTALRRHIAEAGLDSSVTAAELLARRASGDALAARLLDAWAGPLATAIDDLVATLSPGLVLLGGGLGQAAAAALAGSEVRPSWYRARVAPAALGDDAGVIGAALAAMPVASRRLVLVNGVPASGKSRLAAGLSQATGWPVLSLDTIKNEFLSELHDVDRPLNRTLGRASLKAMFATVAEMPAATTVILDAWFGFQPREFVAELISRAGASALAELWCVAPPETIGARYGERAGSRPAGHPGAEYVPELIALAARAQPLRLGPVFTADTTSDVDFSRLAAWTETTLRSKSGAPPDFPPRD